MQGTDVAARRVSMLQRLFVVKRAYRISLLDIREMRDLYTNSLTFVLVLTCLQDETSPNELGHAEQDVVAQSSNKSEVFYERPLLLYNSFR